LNWTKTIRSIGSIRSICIPVEMFEEIAGQAVGGLGLPPVKVGQVEETWTLSLDEYGLYVVLLNVSFYSKIELK